MRPHLSQLTVIYSTHFIVCQNGYFGQLFCCLLSCRASIYIDLMTRVWSFDTVKRRYDDAVVTVYNTPQLGPDTVILYEQIADDKCHEFLTVCIWHGLTKT